VEPAMKRTIHRCKPTEDLSKNPQMILGMPYTATPRPSPQAIRGKVPVLHSCF
jgi:hypothetical protein